MTRLIPAFLALLLSSAPLAAQELTDLAVTIEITSIPATPRPGDIITWRATVQNHGPATATRVLFSSGFYNAPCTDQTIASLAPGERRSVDCSMALPRQLEALLYTFAHAQDQDDPDQANNRVDRSITLTTPPDLTVEHFPPRVIDAGLPFTLTVHYRNVSRTAATGVVLELAVQGGATLRRMPDVCAVSGPAIDCTLGDLAPFGFGSIAIELVAPDASARRIPILASIEGNEDDLEPDSNFLEQDTRTYRTFNVTSTSDAGDGTLRQAIQDANAQCGDGWPCKIAFRIPAAGAKWQTIRPETPLPVVNMAMAVDAATQAAYIGDTNPDGPDIEISGAQLSEGSGLTTVCPVEIRGFAINGFPANGLHYSAASRCPGGAPFGPGGFDAPLIENNYIGTDATGSRAVPNERGIVFDRGNATVRGNVISGNRRSGVVVDGQVMIDRNIIGLDRALTKDLGNGASGVYLGAKSFGTDVFHNHIGFNRHFGVSLDPRATYSSMRANSFQANWNMAIDFGLDGPTEEVPDASTSNPVRRPVIVSARYDASTNTTVVQGVSETYRDRHEVWISVYANDEPDPSGYGEGQYYLGEVRADLNDQHFLFTYPGRPPGRWISATTTRQNIIGLGRAPDVQGICSCGYTTQTSEFSRTVELE